MNTLRSALSACLAVTVLSISAQEEEARPTGLPGDHLDLQGVLEMFRDAHDLESFERALNDPDHNVNNLDLNEDGDVDYLRVVDHAEGDAHAVALQALSGEEEVQDVAVIEVEKTGPASALLQIVGDEDLYGKDVIVEPFEEREGAEKSGPAPVDDFVRVTVNVWAWPCVHWFYGPHFVLWVSPWGWHHRPPWWKPWHPHPWHVYHGFVVHYHAGYWYAPRYRLAHAHAVYAPRRVRSAAVHERYHGKGAHARTRAAASERGRSVAPTQRPGVRKEQRPSRPTAPRTRGNTGRGGGGGGQRGR